MRSIRAGKGLGDALYLQAVCRHLVKRGERLKVATSWPDVFLPLGKAVECVEFTRSNIDVVAHYSMRKAHGTRQFQDCCIQAGIVGPVELRIDWETQGALPNAIRSAAGDRPLVAVQLPRNPMDRKDKFGDELLPDCSRIQVAIDAARARGAYVIQIGAGSARYQFSGIDWDLANQTTVVDLMDIAAEVDAFIGYVSFIVPLAESFDKPLLCIWSRRGLKAAHHYVRQITPQKILEKPTSRAVFDDAPDRAIVDIVNEMAM